MHRLARHSHQVWRKEVDGVEHILWIAASAETGCYAAVFNTGEKDSQISISLRDLELYQPVTATELWSGQQEPVEEHLTVSLSKHGAKAYHLV